MFEKILKNKTSLLTALILLLAAGVRFYNYQNRWALAYDQAWFAIIARYGIEIHKLPLLGPFASGGPFQTGGEWFWIVMAGTNLFPQFVISPWIFITLISIFQVFLMIRLGKLLGGIRFGLLVGLLTAVSSSQILQSANLTNQSVMSLFSIILLYFGFKYLETKKLTYLFYSSLSVGVASSVHLQGVLLSIPLILFFIFAGSFSLMKNFSLIAGLLIPWLPVLYADSSNNFYNTKNMLAYFLHGRSDITYDSLGRRWLTFLRDFVPFSWARIIGGQKIFGYIFILLGIIFCINSLKKNTIKKEWLVSILSVVLIYVTLRYLKTPLYESYLVFLHPFVLLAAASILYQVVRFNKLVGYALVIIVSVASVWTIIPDIVNATNITSLDAYKWTNELEKMYPNEKFAVYDYQYKYTNMSLPLVLNLYAKNKIDNNGRKIGFAIVLPKNASDTAMFQPIIGEKNAYQILDLQASSSAELSKHNWSFVNPSQIYNSVQYWYKK